MSTRQPFYLLLSLTILSGCASKILGTAPLDAPPEFKQKVILQVSDDYEMHQAPRSQYDVGDLQSFHTQHALPAVIEDTFREIFGEVEAMKPGEPRIEAGKPDVPAVFEVRIVDLANDIYNEADSYRGQVTLAVAMKSPRDQIFWQKAFRGEGYVRVDPQFSTGLGPQDAVVDAMRDALEQMKQAILSAPEIRNQLRYYREVDRARAGTEIKV